MKICVYNLRDDEKKYFRFWEKELSVELVVSEEDPSDDNLEIVSGCEGVSVLGQTYIGSDLMDNRKSDRV